MYVFIVINVCEVHKIIRKNTGNMYNFVNFAKFY